MTQDLSLEGKLADGEVGGSLALTEGHGGGLLGGQTATHGAGLTGAEIEGLVLLALDGGSDLLATSLVVDSQNLGDLLADLTAGKQNATQTVRKRDSIRFEVKGSKVEKVNANADLRWKGTVVTYILPSLEAAPPVTLATRSWESSFLSSASWVSISALGLSRRVLRFNFSAGMRGNKKSLSQQRNWVAVRKRFHDEIREDNETKMSTKQVPNDFGRTVTTEK